MFFTNFFIIVKTKYPKKTTDVKTIKNVLFRSWGQSEYEKLKADAIIRANFHLNPDELQISQWSKLYAQAIWLEEWRLKNQAELFMGLFAGD